MYVTHYRNLSYIHELGVKIAKLHRAISFKQTPWIKLYIEFNSNERNKGMHEFEKDVWKRMINSVFFGKCRENMKNIIVRRLTTVLRKKQSSLSVSPISSKASASMICI